uniref:Malto-oligosyltrehalose synthase n=1 Tax=Acidobacterium capsulatum TaxID=33075 RepID=A0A7V4XU41_9BACT
MRRVPYSTYRLQLHKDFTFENAAAVADYLQRLGVSHVYSSPYLQAAPGSMHGYNVVDPERVNEELGGEAGHQRFCERLSELGLGQILDIVPNHMATRRQNRYWWDVLENGPSSRYATWFDIDWNMPEVRLHNKILIPVLGDQYGRVLTQNQIRIEHDTECFRARYMENYYPIAPRSLALPLTKAAQYADNATLNFIADSLSRLPVPDAYDAEMVLSRHRDKTVIYELLHQLCSEQPAVTAAIDRAIAELNADHDALDAFLDLQYYRLAYWRTADQDLGYRRFFDVNTLIGLRVERAHVFRATHELVLQWLDQGVLDGVRIDHPDGLRDPKQYFERLRENAPDAWMVAEKILGPEEELRKDWPIEGTTGYDFLNLCNRLLVYEEGLSDITNAYAAFTHEPVDFDDIAHEKKMNVEHELLGSDVNRLANLFVGICEGNRDRRDYTRAEIRRALREVAACFSVYRTYVVPGKDEAEREDQNLIDQAIHDAKDNRPDLDPALFDFMGDVLAWRARGEMEGEFLQRFQQFTSPVMAKGVEDTTLYCFNPMIGLNEVGSSPEAGALSLEAFHDRLARVQSSHPHTLNTLATHDTKRSDDVRARLAVLTEAPALWKSSLRKWSRANAPFKTGIYPDRNTEYFLYQTLIGAWPISVERVSAYMEKATREAKQQTSWMAQNKEFEDALRHFIEQILSSQEFLAEIEGFVSRIQMPGRINSLAQTLLKLTAPGVPDTYQGGELWDLHLVDPDNRGAVDYDARRSMLSSLEQGMSPEEILQNFDAGLPKLWLIYKALHLRREHPEWFGANADYTPLYGRGPRKDHLIAYLRSGKVAALAPRWSLRLGGWSATSVELPKGRWRNALTGDSVQGGSIRLETLLERFPVALLIHDTE